MAVLSLSRGFLPRVSLRAAVLICSLLAAPVLAQQEESEAGGAESESGQTAEEFQASLHYSQGDIEIENGLARLTLGDRYSYLGPEDSERVLVQAWGNPPSDPPLGMIFPAGMGPLDDDSWAVVLRYQDDGYVDDDDAKDIDYKELLHDMQEGVREHNAERKEAGYPSLELVDWAEPPHYDGATHKLYWAKRLALEGADQHSLNYDIRVLGRRGVLVLSAIGSISQLDAIRGGMQDVLGIVEFNPGHRYADFDPKADRVAAYGIGALIAGGIAAKAGLFAKLGALLLAFKKVIFVGVAGLVAMISRLFGRKSSSETTSGGS